MEHAGSDLGKFREKLSGYKKALLDKEFRKKLLLRLNPEPEKGSDYLIDYLIRVLIFLFPLYIYENNAFMGISFKDVLFGIAVLIMSILGGFKPLQSSRNRPFSYSLKTLMVFCGFLVLLTCFIVQVLRLSPEMPHTYLYIGCFLIVFSTGFISSDSRYYLKILSGAYIIIYVSIYKYIFTGTPTILGVENLLAVSYKIIPMLLLCCLVNSYLYMTEDKGAFQKLYLAAAALGFVVLFLYGDMAAFMIMLLFIMGMHLLSAPTAAFIKKSMILLFLYAFCASNAPLLSYFSTPGITREFDLEYSIYIDILIAVAGLIVTSYWDKIPKDEEAGDTMTVTFSKWYKRSMILLLILIAVAFTYGSRGGSLTNGIGGKVVSGFATSLWNSVSKSSGEIWHILTVYGLAGVLVLTGLGILLLAWAADIWQREDVVEVEKGYILIALLFIVQGFFYQFSSASTPAYMIFIGLALSTGRLRKKEPVPEQVKNDILDLETEVNEDDEIIIWIPNSAKNEIIRENAGRNEEKQEDNSKYSLIFRRYFPRICSLLLSAFSAVLLLLVAFAVQHLFVPASQARGTDSLIMDAVDQRNAEHFTIATADYEKDEIASEAKLDQTIAAESSDLEAVDVAEEVVQENTLESNDEVTETEPAVENEEEVEEEDTQQQEAEEEENSVEAEGTEDTEESDEDIPAGISRGNYRVYDPNARYSAAEDTVTGRNGAVNLRSIPRTDGNSEIIHILEEGETVHRSGIGANGWSKVEYDGRTLYAVTDYLVVDETPEEDGNAEVTTEEPVQETAAEASKTSEKPKTPSSYSVQFTDDNKKVTIWSAGVLQGTMTVTDGEGNSISMTNYGDYYQGNDRDQKRYYNISAPQGETELTINADQGFVEAIKNMGYSGLYFNKGIHSW